MLIFADAEDLCTFLTSVVHVSFMIPLTPRRFSRHKKIHRSPRAKTWSILQTYRRAQAALAPRFRSKTRCQCQLSVRHLESSTSSVSSTTVSLPLQMFNYLRVCSFIYFLHTSSRYRSLWILGLVFRGCENIVVPLSRCPKKEIQISQQPTGPKHLSLFWYKKCLSTLLSSTAAAPPALFGLNGPWIYLSNSAKFWP